MAVSGALMLPGLRSSRPDRNKTNNVLSLPAQRHGKVYQLAEPASCYHPEICPGQNLFDSPRRPTRHGEAHKNSPLAGPRGHRLKGGNNRRVGFSRSPASHTRQCTMTSPVTQTIRAGATGPLITPRGPVLPPPPPGMNERLLADYTDDSLNRRGCPKG